MEIWDAYRADGSLAGCDLVRGEPIPPGLFHLVSEVLVRHTDGGYLLMQRDWRKEKYGGMFDATAGGSALKGETPLQAALRELREETGIIADGLTPLYVCRCRQSIYHGYLCVTGCGKSEVPFSPARPSATAGYRSPSFCALSTAAPVQAYAGNGLRAMWRRWRACGPADPKRPRT